MNPDELYLISLAAALAAAEEAAAQPQPQFRPLAMSSGGETPAGLNAFQTNAFQTNAFE